MTAAARQKDTFSVIPAQAGIQGGRKGFIGSDTTHRPDAASRAWLWIPACAGMTMKVYRPAVVQNGSGRGEVVELRGAGLSIGYSTNACTNVLRER
jgi:hypothetical protein